MELVLKWAIPDSGQVLTGLQRPPVRALTAAGFTLQSLKGELCGSTEEPQTIGSSYNLMVYVFRLGDGGGTSPLIGRGRYLTCCPVSRQTLFHVTTRFQLFPPYNASNLRQVLIFVSEQAGA